MQNNFRYDISFLRVIAIISVVLFHYQFSFFKGGFIGVDVFFVISGFLMTKIIVNGFNQNTFNLVSFYKKRVTRIIPGLLVMILLTSIAVFTLLPTQFVSFLSSAFSSSLFFSNFYYYSNVGYFEQKSHLNFLLHTWSLSVEWQFYMLFPIILIAGKKLGLLKENRLKYFFLVLLLLSFFIMIYTNSYNQSLSFFSTQTRAWEMILGSFAFIYNKKVYKINNNAKLVISLLSYTCIIFYFVKAKDYNWPSYITILPAMATAIIIALQYDWSIYKNKILKYIGDISYSLYLYHWPLYVFSYFFTLDTRLRYKLFFILVSVILAILSYEIVEKRNYSKQVNKIIFASVCIFLISFSLFKISPQKYLGDLGNLAYATTLYKDSETANQQYGFHKKHLRHDDSVSAFDTLQFRKITNGKDNILLFGDSHAGMFGKTIENIGKDLDVNIIQITADATYPKNNAEGKYKGPKDLFNYTFKNFFPKYKNNINLVIINSNYIAYDREKIDENINSSSKFFSELKIPLLFIGQTDNNIIDYCTTFYLKKQYNILPNNTTNKNQDVIELNKHLKSIIGNNYIDLVSENINKISADKTPYIYDTNHLTYYGTEQYREIINSKIKEVLSLKHNSPK